MQEINKIRVVDSLLCLFVSIIFFNTSKSSSRFKKIISTIIIKYFSARLMTKNFPTLEKKYSKKGPRGGGREMNKHIGKINYGQWVDCNYLAPNGLRQNVMQMVICMPPCGGKKQIILSGRAKRGGLSFESKDPPGTFSSLYSQTLA